MSKTPATDHYQDDNIHDDGDCREGRKWLEAEARHKLADEMSPRELTLWQWLETAALYFAGFGIGAALFKLVGAMVLS